MIVLKIANYTIEQKAVLLKALEQAFESINCPPNHIGCSQTGCAKGRVCYDLLSSIEFLQADVGLVIPREKECLTKSVEGADTRPKL